MSTAETSHVEPYDAHVAPDIVAPDGWVYQIPLTPPDAMRVHRLHSSQHDTLAAEMSLALDRALAGLLMETLQ